jgi:polyketide cyclase/dehydrase/lipid transport protein
MFGTTISDKEQDMQVRASTEINATADATWQIFGEDFEGISKWLDSINSSSLDGELAVGATRTCNFPKDLIIKEKLTHFDPKARALTYLILSGLPSFMLSVSNAWTIEDIGNNRSRATSVVTAKLAWYAIPMGPMVKIGLGKTLKGALRQLAAAAEKA